MTRKLFPVGRLEPQGRFLISVGFVISTHCVPQITASIDAKPEQREKKNNAASEHLRCFQMLFISVLSCR